MNMLTLPKLLAVTQACNYWNAVMNNYADLTRSVGGSLTGKTTEEGMVAIIKFAVRDKIRMVARVTLHSMHQDRDGYVRILCARLSGQAGVCKFIIKCHSCNTDVYYTETVVRDVLTRGVADPDIQLAYLGIKIKS